MLPDPQRKRYRESYLFFAYQVSSNLMNFFPRWWEGIKSVFFFFFGKKKCFSLSEVIEMKFWISVNLTQFLDIYQNCNTSNLSIFMGFLKFSNFFYYKTNIGLKIAAYNFSLGLIFIKQFYLFCFIQSRFLIKYLIALNAICSHKWFHRSTYVASRVITYMDLKPTNQKNCFVIGRCVPISLSKVRKKIFVFIKLRDFTLL